jgi:hypothetical protein
MSTARFALARCISCDKTFPFNPQYRPALLVLGAYRYLCRTCLERINQVRVPAGRHPILFDHRAYDPAPFSYLGDSAHGHQ